MWSNFLLSQNEFLNEFKQQIEGNDGKVYNRQLTKCGGPANNVIGTCGTESLFDEISGSNSEFRFSPLKQLQRD